MKLYALRAYIGYRWKSKDLHGVHSPFIYDLNQHVLHHTAGHELPEYDWLQPRYNRLVGKLLAYYNCHQVMVLPPELDEEPEQKQDLILMTGAFPGQWVSLFNRHKHLIKDNTIVAVAGIHDSKRHSTKWKRLYKHPKVRASVDLYGVGLLFFRPELKEKQHFVLRYK